MSEYCVKQNIVNYDNEVVESRIVRDGLLSLETACEIAEELRLDNILNFRDLNLNSGYNYQFVAEHM